MAQEDSVRDGQAAGGIPGSRGRVLPTKYHLPKADLDANIPIPLGTLALKYRQRV